MEIIVKMRLQYRGSKKATRDDLDTIQSTIASEIENGTLDFTLGNRDLTGSVTIARDYDKEAEQQERITRLTDALGIAEGVVKNAVDHGKPVKPALKMIREALKGSSHPGPMSRADKKARKIAIAQHYQEGTLEIDDNAKVSRAEGNEDKGTYVEAWIWIPDQKGGA